MWSNFHTHTNYCDGKGVFKDFLTSPNIKSLGFSSHAPLPFDCPWSMRLENLDSYLQEIKQLATIEKNIELYAGLEVDYIPALTGPQHFKQVDYTVGSIHFVDKLPNGNHWEIDGMHTLFLEGLKSIFNNKYRDAWSRYFELTRDMIRNSPPTVLGHLDKMKIQNIDHKFFDEQEIWYRNEMTQTIDALKGTDIIVEVNTRGLYQKKSVTTYPSPWVLVLLKTAGIPITLSSDAHHPDQLTQEFPETAHLLNKIGFKKLSILTEGEWKEVNFSENGLLLGRS